MSEKTRGIFLFVFSLTISALMEIWLLLTPSLTINPFIFNLSLQRFLIILFVFFVFIVEGICLFLIQKKSGWNAFQRITESQILHPLSFLICLFSGLVLIGLFLKLFGPRTQFFIRLLPLFSLSFCLSLLWILYQEWAHGWQLGGKIRAKCLSFLKGMFQFVNQKVNVLEGYFSRTWMVVILLMLVNFPFVFWNAIKYKMPMGFAGLYTQMAEEIAHNHFLLPMEISYYGPGGVPFAYPPLGAYLMAFVTKFFSISSLSYLRFAPPFFSLVATILFYFLVTRYTKSRVAGFAAANIFACSSVLYGIQTAAGGIFRALALCFLFAGLLVYQKSNQVFRFRPIFLTGLFFALTLLSHLGYAFIFALVLFISALSKPFSWHRWRFILLSGISGIVLSSPWWALVIYRYGLSVFFNAFGSHGNNYFLLILSGNKPLLEWLAISFDVVLQNPYVIGLSVIGVVSLLFSGDIFIPLLAFSLMFSSSENGRYLIIVGALAIGVILNQISRRYKMQKELKHLSIIGICFLIICLLIINLSEVQNINKEIPAFSEETLRFADYIKENVPGNSEFLFAGVLQGGSGQGTEWLPYLFQLKPSFGDWGGEWEGTATSNDDPIAKILQCEQIQSYSCLEETVKSSHANPDILIAYSTDTQLNSEILASGKWINKYDEGTYELWIKK